MISFYAHKHIILVYFTNPVFSFCQLISSSVKRNEENATKDKSLFISGSIRKPTCEPTNLLSGDLQGMKVLKGTSMHPCELQPHF